MEETLQHHQTTQCFGLPPDSPGNHHPNRPKVSHALTFKLDPLTGAVQFICQKIAERLGGSTDRQKVNPFRQYFYLLYKRYLEYLLWHM